MPVNHYNDPISTDPSHVRGNSRKAGDASVMVKNEVVTSIIDHAKAFGLSTRDTANLLAIARLESGFNPDAAARGSTTSASGVFQITDQTAEDAYNRLSGTSRANGIELGTYDRFDLHSNIQYGIVIYLDKKKRAGSDDVAEIYKKYNTNPDEYNKYLDVLRSNSSYYLNHLESNTPVKVSDGWEIPSTFHGELNGHGDYPVFGSDAVVNDELGHYISLKYTAEFLASQIYPLPEIQTASIEDGELPYEDPATSHARSRLVSSLLHQLNDMSGFLQAYMDADGSIIIRGEDGTVIELMLDGWGTKYVPDNQGGFRQTEFSSDGSVSVTHDRTVSFDFQDDGNVHQRIEDKSFTGTEPSKLLSHVVTEFLRDAHGNVEVERLFLDGSRTVVTEYANGSYRVFSIDSEGNQSVTEYSVDGSFVASTWTATDGSVWTYSDDGLGDVMSKSYSPDGSLLAEKHQYADGTLSETHYLDGSSATETYYADGTRSSYVLSANGMETTTSYAADGTLLVDSWTSADGARGGGNYYNANGAVEQHWEITYLEDGSDEQIWSRTDGSHGTMYEYADGSSESTEYNPDGSYITGLGSADGSWTWKTYAADGSAIGTRYTYADGSYGSDTFNTDGSSFGSFVTADGTTSTYARDAAGNIVTSDYASDGTLLGRRSQYADGSTDGRTTNDSVFDGTGFDGTSLIYHTDGSYTVTARMEDGGLQSLTYSADGREVSGSYESSDGVNHMVWSYDYASDGTYGYTEKRDWGDGSSYTADSRYTGDGRELELHVKSQSADGSRTTIEHFLGQDETTDEYRPDGSLSNERVVATDGTTTSYEYGLDGTLLKEIIWSADGNSSTTYNEDRSYSVMNYSPRTGTEWYGVTTTDYYAPDDILLRETKSGYLPFDREYTSTTWYSDGNLTSRDYFESGINDLSFFWGSHTDYQSDGSWLTTGYSSSGGSYTWQFDAFSNEQTWTTTLADGSWYSSRTDFDSGLISYSSSEAPDWTSETGFYAGDLDPVYISWEDDTYLIVPSNN